MEELAVAIRKRFATDAAGAAARAYLTGLWHLLVEAGTAYPFADYRIVTGTADDSLASTFRLPLVQFTVYDKRRKGLAISPGLSVIQGAELLEELYVNVILTDGFSDWCMVRATPEQSIIPIWTENDEFASASFAIRYEIGK